MSDEKPRVAVCPGSYDPVTNGHVDIITRASRVFDKVIVGVVNQPIRKQKTLFTAEERKDFLEQALAELDNVEVEVFSNLLVEFAQENGATRDRQGPARDLRLRVRVRDEPAQPQARPGDRVDVHLRLGQLQLPLLDRASRRWPPSAATSATWCPARSRRSLAERLKRWPLARLPGHVGRRLQFAAREARNRGSGYSGPRKLWRTNGRTRTHRQAR